MLIVSKPVTGNHLFRKMRHQPGVEEIALDSIRRILPQQNPTNAAIEAPLPIQVADQVTEYTSAEVEAAAKIRNFWRKRFPGLLQRRKYLSTPEGQIFRRYSNLCATRRSSLKAYIVLLSSGVDVCLKVDSMRVALEQQYGRLMGDIETADPSKDAYEAIDGYLQRVRNLEHELNSQANRISVDNIAQVLEKGSLRDLRHALAAVEASIVAAESGLARIVTDMHNV